MVNFAVKSAAKKFFEKEFEERGEIVTGGQNRENLDFICQNVNLKNDSYILDVACGLGFLSKYLGSKYPYSRVFGVDISEKLIQEATKNNSNKNIIFRSGDSETLLFPDNYFDLITCRFAFHHFHSPIKVLREMHRILKHNGKIIIIDPLFKDLKIDRIINDIFVKVEQDLTGHVKFHNNYEFKSMAKNAGLYFLDQRFKSTSFQLGLDGFSDNFEEVPDYVKNQLFIKINGKDVFAKLPVAVNIFYKE